MTSGQTPSPKRRGAMMRDSAKRKGRFLDHLAETFDVDGACAAAGLCWRDMCTLRDEDPEFAAQWERVIAGGYERIEIMLLRIAGAASADEGKADVALAGALLKQRWITKRARRGAGGGAPKPDREREIAAIMRSVRAMRVGGGKKGGKDEADAALDGMAKMAGLADRERGGGQAGGLPAPAG